MSDFQTILSVISDSGGDRDAFIKAYQARLAKGNTQPAPTEPTPTRKGDVLSRVTANILAEAASATEAQKRTIAPVQASLNEPKKTGRGNTELRELRESVNLGHLVGRRE